MSFMSGVYMEKWMSDVVYRQLWWGKTCETHIHVTSSHHPCFPYGNNLAGIVLSLLENKICMWVWAGLTFQFQLPMRTSLRERFTEAPLPGKTELTFIELCRVH